MTITYHYLDDDAREQSAQWHGSVYCAVEAALNHLSAHHSNVTHIRGDEWSYRAAEDKQWYTVFERDLIELGAAILDGHSDVYSVWCTRRARLTWPKS